jgi:hypothetical protein
MSLPIIMKTLPTKGTGVFRRDEPRRGGTPVSQRALGILQSNADVMASEGLSSAQCLASSLLELALMWEELGRICEIVPSPGWQDEKAAYDDCAKQLREVMAGNLACIAKM